MAVNRRKNGMKIESLIGFITKLEEMRKMCNPEDMVKDSCGTYPKNEVLANLIKDARLSRELLLCLRKRILCSLIFGATSL